MIKWLKKRSFKKRYTKQSMQKGQFYLWDDNFLLWVLLDEVLLANPDYETEWYEDLEFDDSAGLDDPIDYAEDEIVAGLPEAEINDAEIEIIEALGVDVVNNTALEVEVENQNITDEDYSYAGDVSDFGSSDDYGSDDSGSDD